MWAPRGTKRRRVKETRAAMLERWTGMTVCYSQGCQPGNIPKWAALFKAESGARIHLDAEDGVKVHFAPNGSYPTQQVLEYLEWLLPEADSPADAVVPVMDWYSAHLAEEVQELVLLRAQSPALFLGGTTGLQAVCDVWAHKELSEKYKALEAEDHRRELLRRPGKIPRWSRQDVLRRGTAAWRQLRHERMEDGHVRCGYTTLLEGG